MALVKKLLASVLVSIIFVSNITVAFAIEEEYGTDNNITEAEVTNIDDLNTQLNDLYHRVGEELNINYLYVKILHMIAGGKAVYAETLPNIYADQTVESLSGSFDIEGANQTYELAAPWVNCPDDTISRPSKYYIPDAAYNITANIITIMNNRYNADRGIMQNYFNALDNSVKTNILFCEAVLQYTGSSIESVNSFYNIYEKIIYDKDSNENVIESNENGEFHFKSKYEEIIRNNGINTDRELEILSIILRFDSKLAASSDTNDISTDYVVPYKVGYTSRENMMIAAMSLVGKVRYVWGGGHIGTGTIEGINPAWQLYYNIYSKDENEESYCKCIRPNNGWCPLHGVVNGGNTCLFNSETVYSAEDYINERKDIMDTSTIETESFENMMNNINISNGISSHRLDGLDCSGFASWLYNQITDSEKRFDSGALGFIGQSGMESLGVGGKLLPGDVFSWGSHIIVIVGPSVTNSSAYVMIESAPNVVKFGVAYYSGAKPGDIAEALKIAKEANDLFGDLDKSEQTGLFNMTKLTYNGEEDDPLNGYHDCGRLKQNFIDENTVLSDYNKRIIDMTATEIIQHTINNMTYKYLNGIGVYKGELFNTEMVDVNSTNIEVDQIEDLDIVLTTELN